MVNPALSDHCHVLRATCFLNAGFSIAVSRYGEYPSCRGGGYAGDNQHSDDPTAVMEAENKDKLSSRNRKILYNNSGSVQDRIPTPAYRRVLKRATD